MRDIVEQIRRWWEAGQPFAVATVVDVRKSAPRQPGAAMAVGPGGEVVGNVSGGCVEGAVYETAQEVLHSGQPVTVSYGYSDEEAFAVGLTCGGEIDLYVERIVPSEGGVYAALLDALAAEDPVAMATVVGGPAALGTRMLISGHAGQGSLGNEGMDVAVSDDARGMLDVGRTGVRHYGPHGERRVDDVAVLVQTFAPRPRMLVFGAIDFAAAVARMGAFLGYRVTVCDARATFATAGRFPEADEVVVAWPHRYLAETSVDARTVVCVLTHDPKFDVPLLEMALRTDASYVGVMGSRRTHTDRIARLREIGVPESALERLHSPIGLELGARTPEETAVSIAAEIIQQRWGGSGRPLRETSGRIHEDPRATAPT